MDVDWERFSLPQLDLPVIGARFRRVAYPQSAASFLVEVKVCNVIQCNTVSYICELVSVRKREAERDRESICNAVLYIHVFVCVYVCECDSERLT